MRAVGGSQTFRRLQRWLHTSRHVLSPTFGLVEEIPATPLGQSVSTMAWKLGRLAVLARGRKICDYDLARQSKDNDENAPKQEQRFIRNDGAIRVRRDNEKYSRELWRKSIGSPNARHRESAVSAVAGAFQKAANSRMPLRRGLRSQ